MSFKEIEKICLGDFSTIKGGKRLPKGSTLITERNIHPYIKVKDMNGGKQLKLGDAFEFVDIETQKKIENYTVKENDLIISIVGTIGLVSKIDKSLDCANLTENCAKIVDLENCDADYLYYFLTSDAGQYEMKKGTVGSTQPKLPIYNINKIQVPMPEIGTQKAIAHILSSLDDKIEINNQINKTLENLAQAIYKQWFVDFEFPNEDGEPYQSSGGEMVESDLGRIPEEWEVGYFCDLVNVKYGKDHKKLLDGDIPVYGSGGVMRYVNKSLYSLETVLIPRKGTLNNVIYINEPFWSVDTMFYTEMKYPHIAKYVYCYMKTKDLLSMNNGSAVPSMTTIILNKLLIINSPIETIQRFNELIKPLFLKIDSNFKETQKLESIRDSLLPILMSGEKRVPIDFEDEAS